MANAAERSILVPRDRHYAIGERSFTLELAGCGTTCQKPTNTNFLGPEPSKTVRWDKATKAQNKTPCCLKTVLGHLVSHGKGGMIYTRLSMVSPARTACNHKNDLNPVLLLFFISVFRDRNHKVQVDYQTPRLSDRKSENQNWRNTSEKKKRRFKTGQLLGGTLQELWTIVESVCDGLDLLILSVEQLHGLTKLLLGTSLADDEDEYMSVLSRLQAKTKFKRVALCRKIRYSTGVQRRWSLLVDAHTQNKSKPIYHIPKDECGGGSAWAAGMIYSLLEQLPITDALRRADLVAALCQTSAGDFSQRTGEDLRTLEASLASEKRNLTFEIWEDETHETPSALPVMPVGLSQSLPSISIETTLQKMKEAKVLAIFRVKGSAQVAIDRGMELASLGYKAMEITIDSPDWKTILSTLRQRLPADVVLGIGTVMDDTVSEIPLAKSLGASFALSPIDPIGLIEVCTSLGVLAVPSAFTSNECWSMHRRGARLIKLFHAGLASPAILKAMLEVTPLGENLNILPSGSVSPSNASEWLKAGAAVVGMGSNLVGKDVNLKPGTTEFQAAVDDWKAKGRPVVEKLIKELA